ncbi:hypothetical protein FPHYL_13401 [Fusarium phyllophilum]|uniref:Heterokaryon incompatibility domain-containing protein n=1 Tax=Fusarium phyllophilum TaxID=47803 RepID=A0A8H5IDY7_9HYPO|nr:hypothetical protein FPHYL_13401 [Fusarium phyllophilum]
MATSIVLRDAASTKNSCAHRKLHWWNRITFSQLESSASSCRLCSLYRDIALDLVRGHFPDISVALVEDEAEEALKLEELTMRRHHNSLAIRVSDYEVILDVFADRNTHFFEVAGNGFVGMYRVGQYTNSNESFEHAEEWVYECLSTHTCPRPGTSKTRGDEYPYVCLSHLWGDPIHKQLKTTTRTLDSHMENIEWESLPATFKDAVTVCRSMNVKYLWIDSLCILQSFAEITPTELEATRHDFALENSNMARTYQNFHFTISADLSDHMDSGFFSRFPVDEYKKDVITDRGSAASLYIRRHINHYQDHTPSLETRGWTLQEFLLPPRVLHFGGVGHRPRCYRAPSWSWAAVDTDSGCNWWWPGGIEHHAIMLDDEPEQACGIVQPDCALDDDDLNLGDQIFCAAIAGVEDFSKVDCGCLALKHIDGDTYQRVGFCTIGARRADPRPEREDITESELEDFAWPGSGQVQIRIV